MLKACEREQLGNQDAILFISKQCIYKIYKSAQYEIWLQNYNLTICSVTSYINRTLSKNSFVTRSKNVQKLINV